MTIRSFLCQLAFSLPTIIQLHAQDATPLPVAVLPTDPSIRIIGRADLRSAEGPRFAWAGTTLAVAFTGTALNVDLGGENNRFEILVDGKKTGVLALKKGRGLYRVAEGLAPNRTHVAELFQRTEPLFGTAQFFGFQLESNQKTANLPARPERRIEFIGDSITCGYGNEAASEREPFSPETENHYLAFGPITARALKAESITVSWTGGWLSDKAPEGRAILPKIYPRALPDRPKSLWDFSTWIPQVVVINLGTNDFSGAIPDKDDWTSQYRAFLTTIRQNYPDAHFFLCTGPMLGGESLAALREDVKSVVEAEASPKVHLVEFPEQKYEDGLGANYHPSLKTHEKMAAHLTAAIQKVLDW